tara:strand:+ start:188 stop:679 length:492 start_codon:yes stop_codon:yes gene_type:complete
MVIDAARVSSINYPTPEEVEKIATLLGRTPEGDFEVVVVDSAGEPVVIRNGPIMNNGRPMPTRYWLVDRELCRLVARLEGDGGVRAAEGAVDSADLERAHAQYAEERDAHIPYNYSGPRPQGGVGGTRKGVKCLHTHLANHLVTDDDPVGVWVVKQLEIARLV